MGGLRRRERTNQWIFPHLLATLFTRRYLPGTGTALLLNLPATILLIYFSLQDGYVRLQKLLWVGPLVFAGILAAIPALFAMGRFQWARTKNDEGSKGSGS